MNQIATLPALKQDIARMGVEFGKALPGHITADKFVRTAQTAIALTRNIDKVKNAGSLLAACTKAAADGLILDGREAALVIDYNGDVQYRPMMRGLLKLAYNSGVLKSLVVESVRMNDLFDYQPTRSGEPIIHKIDLKSDRGDVYAVYALAEFKDGGVIHDVMTVSDVNRIRDRSDAWKAFVAKKIKSTPWSTDWSEMARKTVFRRLSKYLPASSDREDRLQQAAERIDEDYTFDIDAEAAPANTPAPTAKKRGGAAAALKDVTPAKPAQAKPQAEPERTEDGEAYDGETGEIMDYEGPDQRPGDDI
jgi:recombination protein RecT